MILRRVLPLAQGLAVLIACISLVIAARGADAGMAPEAVHHAVHVVSELSAPDAHAAPVGTHAACDHAASDLSSGCNTLACCLIAVQPVAALPHDLRLGTLVPLPSAGRAVVALATPLPERPPRAL